MKHVKEYTSKLSSEIIEDSYFEQYTNSGMALNKVKTVFSLLAEISNKDLWDIVANPQCCLLVCFLWDHYKTTVLRNMRHLGRI